MVSLPSLDSDVRKMLRSISEPITYFGEENWNRRDRLKKLLEGHPQISTDMEISSSPTNDELFYTYGPPNLLPLRTKILNFSKEAAKIRKERVGLTNDSEPESKIPETCNLASEVGDSRPLSCVRISPRGSVAVGGWSGAIKIFRENGLTFSGTVDVGMGGIRCCAVEWLNGELLIGGFSDGSIKFWNGLVSVHAENNQPSGRITRLSRLPLSSLFVSATSEGIWTLHDGTSAIYDQEGHASGIFAIAAHPDCSLIASGDEDGVLRLWDLRSGRVVGGWTNTHVGGMTALDFADNGWWLASGGADNSVCIWDLRKAGPSATGPLAGTLLAHSKSVGGLKWKGNSLVSGGYDGLVRVWSGRKFQVQQEFCIPAGGRVAAVDVGVSGNIVAACSDRVVREWSQEGRLKMEL